MRIKDDLGTFKMIDRFRVESPGCSRPDILIRSMFSGSRDVLGQPDRGWFIVEPVSSKFCTHFLINWIDGAWFYAVCCNESTPFIIQIGLAYAERKLSPAEWCHGTKFPLAALEFRKLPPHLVLAARCSYRFKYKRTFGPPCTTVDNISNYLLCI